ncbi:DUF2535 family protein [Bacillus sp. Marseille-P3661]|uniref:DUF2535 family protein n=1 Tax=Bacillus sp. Marseille-P3661 TaxID=1936234 RepID=UPI000C832418|nr:DUF2535 family protein [Bacillus sp. Marseille-P3661]
MKFTVVKLEHESGQTINIVDVPIFMIDNTNNYDISIYLEMLISEINKLRVPNETYSLLKYLENSTVGSTLLNAFKN